MPTENSLFKKIETLHNLKANFESYSVEYLKTLWAMQQDPMTPEVYISEGTELLTALVSQDQPLTPDTQDKLGILYALAPTLGWDKKTKTRTPHEVIQHLVQPYRHMMDYLTHVAGGAVRAPQQSEMTALLKNFERAKRSVDHNATGTYTNILN